MKYWPIAKLRGDLHLVPVSSRSGIAHSIERDLLSLGDASLWRGRNSPEPHEVLKLTMISTPSIRVSPLSAPWGPAGQFSSVSCVRAVTKSTPSDSPHSQTGAE